MTPPRSQEGTPAASTALVPVDTSSCPACGAAAGAVTVLEPQLVRHGGYGATRRTEVAVCSVACGWSRISNVTEVRP